MIPDPTVTPRPAFPVPGFRRRSFLQAGAFASLGLSLPSRLLQAEATTKNRAAEGRRATIRSCILVYFYGGPSHIDSWDMKPSAPKEVRGEFSPISTTIPGMQVCEHLPRMAKMAHKWSVIRSMHHPMTNHNAAAVEAMCGRTPLRGDLELLDDDALSFPAYGAVLSYLLPDSPIGLPHVALPHVMYNVVQLPGQTAGFLGPAYERFQITSDPNAAQFDVSTLKLPTDVSAGRLKERNQLLSVIDRQPVSPLSRPSGARSRSITAKRSPSCVPRPSASAWISPRSRPPSATAMAATPWGRACFWLAAWSSRACGSSMSTTASTTGRTQTGTVIRAFSRGTVTTFCRRPTRDSPHLSKISMPAACSIRR